MTRNDRILLAILAGLSTWVIVELVMVSMRSVPNFPYALMSFMSGAGLMAVLSLLIFPLGERNDAES